LVGEIYDYMIGIVIVGIIFVAAMFTIPSISFINLRQVDQQQLRNTALNLFNAILLGDGSPSNWGSTYPFNQSNVESFGLSLSGQSSMYTLDIDKLQRLNTIGP
jgi:type II secretory pathway pseudopilin PulG